MHQKGIRSPSPTLGNEVRGLTVITRTQCTHYWPNFDTDLGLVQSE